jgi:hypothetical protein
MEIKTSKGHTYEVRFIGAMLRNGKRMLMEMVDDRPLAEIAADFDGLKTITKTDSTRPNVKEVYEGFTRLVGINRDTGSDGVVRLTFERDDEA